MRGTKRKCVGTVPCGCAVCDARQRALLDGMRAIAKAEACWANHQRANDGDLANMRAALAAFLAAGGSLD